MSILKPTFPGEEGKGNVSSDRVRGFVESKDGGVLVLYDKDAEWPIAVRWEEFREGAVATPRANSLSVVRPTADVRPRGPPRIKD